MLVVGLGHFDGWKDGTLSNKLTLSNTALMRINAFAIIFGDLAKGEDGGVDIHSYTVDKFSTRVTSTRSSTFLVSSILPKTCLEQMYPRAQQLKRDLDHSTDPRNSNQTRRPRPFSLPSFLSLGSAKNDASSHRPRDP